MASNKIIVANIGNFFMYTSKHQQTRKHPEKIEWLAYNK